MPDGAVKVIRSVNIYDNGEDRVYGFHFFDKDRKLMWEFGKAVGRIQTVLIAENEMIVGVRARYREHLELNFTSFQFVIATRWRKRKYQAAKKTAAIRGFKKPQRFRPSTVALRETRRFQKSTEPPFREIRMDLKLARKISDER